MKKASFIGGGVFWDMVTAFRVCKVEGRYGAGKTSLSFMIAARMLAEGRVKRVISNIPCTFSENTVFDQDNKKYYVDEEKIPSPLTDACIVLDESWIYIEGRQDVLDYAGFIRHFEHFLILPSVMDIHPRLSFFTCQRVFNAYTLGFPLWFYRWNIRQKSIKENGLFAVQNPTAIFGHYPKKFVAGTDGGISNAIEKTSTAKGFKGTRRKQKSRQVGVTFEALDETPVDDIENAFDEATTDIQYVLDDFQKTVKKASFIRR